MEQLLVAMMVAVLDNGKIPDNREGSRWYHQVPLLFTLLSDLAK